MLDRCATPLAWEKNGELLSLAAAERFDVLLTHDKSIPNQQSMTSR